MHCDTALCLALVMDAGSDLVVMTEDSTDGSGNDRRQWSGTGLALVMAVVMTDDSHDLFFSHTPHASQSPL